MLTVSSYMISALKRFIKYLIDLYRPPQVELLATLRFLLIKHIYWVTNFSDKVRKEVTELGEGRWNQDRASPAKQDGNVLHMRASLSLCSIMI